MSMICGPLPRVSLQPILLRLNLSLMLDQTNTLSNLPHFSQRPRMEGGQLRRFQPSPFFVTHDALVPAAPLMILRCSAAMMQAPRTAKIRNPSSPTAAPRAGPPTRPAAASSSTTSPPRPHHPSCIIARPSRQRMRSPPGAGGGRLTSSHRRTSAMATLSRGGIPTRTDPRRRWRSTVGRRHRRAESARRARRWRCCWRRRRCRG
jgi:hypothetical protein